VVRHKQHTQCMKQATAWILIGCIGNRQHQHQHQHQYQHAQELPGYPRPMLTPQQTKSFSNTFLASYPLEVARQLTLIEHEFFQSLTLPDDLSNLSTTDNRAKALSEWTSWSNKVSSSSDSARHQHHYMMLFLVGIVLVVERNNLASVLWFYDVFC
jgi:hypothetical protein